MNQLTFASENLRVDYVTFNFDQLNQSQKTNLINYFYKLAKNKQIQWDLFNSGILSLFDLNYLRPSQFDEVHPVIQFLRISQEEIRKKRINAKLESSLNQQILKIAILY